MNPNENEEKKASSTGISFATQLKKFMEDNGLLEVILILRTETIDLTTLQGELFAGQKTRLFSEIWESVNADIKNRIEGIVANEREIIIYRNKPK